MDNKFCKIHNDPAIFFEKDAQRNLVYYCRFCVQQRLNIQNMEELDKEEKQELKQLEMQFDKSIKLLNDFAEVLEYFTEQIQQKLQKFKKQVDQSISLIIEKKNQVKNISNDFANLQLNQIVEQRNLLNNQLTQILLQHNNQIKELEISTRLNKLYQSIEEECKLKQFDDIQKTTVFEKKLQQQEDEKKIKVIEKKFNYQLMRQFSYKQQDNCCTIAFNKDATIMIAGCRKLIKVFEFKTNILEEIQQLSEHQKEVYCLYFMKKSNKFISGSLDSTMIIWKQNQNWLCTQVLKSHTSDIQCITMNQNEDLLISGSGDKTIKFWSNQNNFWGCNQSIDCQSIVYSISLNDAEDKLIACVRNNEILVIGLQGKEWMIQQNLSVEQYGYRLCYINQNQFIFQPIYGQHLQIFNYDAKDQTYKLVQELKYQNKETRDGASFSIQYLSHIGLILVKNGTHVHLIKKNQKGQCTVDQSIHFNTPLIFGCITNDGKYIATWDDQSKEIQIRKFEF